jgi:hypothetical protein
MIKRAMQRTEKLEVKLELMQTKSVLTRTFSTTQLRLKEHRVEVPATTNDARVRCEKDCSNAPTVVLHK